MHISWQQLSQSYISLYRFWCMLTHSILVSVSLRNEKPIPDLLSPPPPTCDTDLKKILYLVLVMEVGA
jgi:hypothetical protein